ncbi:MAG: hypothetical protein AB7G37_03395 [Solirubrobacteraceae bacterium]
MTGLGTWYYDYATGLHWGTNRPLSDPLHASECERCAAAKLAVRVVVHWTGRNDVEAGDHAELVIDGDLAWTGYLDDSIDALHATARALGGQVVETGCRPSRG